jgi:hypothetical protein
VTTFYKFVTVPLFTCECESGIGIWGEETKNSMTLAEDRTPVVQPVGSELQQRYRGSYCVFHP